MMTDKAKFKVVSVAAAVFAVLWLVTWIVFAILATKPSCSPKFQIMTRKYVKDMHWFANHVSVIFQENNIDHSLCAGSLLGSARYGHAIEHDDDIDMMVKESDLKVITDVLTENPDISIKSKNFGKQVYMKGIGPYLDLFVLVRSSASSKWKFKGHFDRDIAYFTDHDWDNVAPLPFGPYNNTMQLIDPSGYLTRFYGDEWETVAYVKPLHGAVSLPFHLGLDIVNVMRGGMNREYYTKK